MEILLLQLVGILIPLGKKFKFVFNIQTKLYLWGFRLALKRVGYTVNISDDLLKSMIIYMHTDPEGYEEMYNKRLWEAINKGQDPYVIG